MKLLVTGGAGFIGSTFVRMAVARGYGVVVLDKLTYAGDTERLQGTGVPFYRGDVKNRELVEAVLEHERVDAIVHFAAETHVDRSILDAFPFVETNVGGTQVLLDAARTRGIGKFVYVSTDEVYGELGRDGMFTEESPMRPNSPYAASKAAADMLALAYHRTYGVPVCVVRPCNNYGPWQYPEKLIPVVIYKALAGQPVPVYGKGENVREWLYVEDCCTGILAVLEKGRPGTAYNLGSGEERTNLEVVRSILGLLGKDSGLIKFVKDRPGHDFRYRVDFSRAVRELGFRPRVAFPCGLELTVRWYLENRKWLFEKARQLEALWSSVYREGAAC
ncbi:dTDP-glucose 4,6-dehydratase [Thermanaeromonas toyohensis]|uniref:dTDP-glucose 4,6-dehydratase n=1 Tax=Thermanaeromonas toyohensis TaxID=161154 RepID=UPI000A071DBD|nr:dTDP-glucose 4,6-dehydratase [Thermanaeromonas toyohensis]